MHIMYVLEVVAYKRQVWGGFVRNDGRIQNIPLIVFDDIRGDVIGKI